MSNIQEVANEKYQGGKMMTMREYRVYRIESCSDFRDNVFPRFCIQNGVPSGSVLSPQVWDSLWKMCGEEDFKRHREFLQSAHTVPGIGPVRKARVVQDTKATVRLR